MVELKEANDFVVTQFKELRDDLQFVASTPALSHEHLKQLESTLEEALPWMAGFLSFPKEDATVWQGMQNAKGDNYAPDRLEAISKLSSYLHINQYISASLMTYAQANYPSYGRAPSETAFIVFHELRSDLIECWKLIYNLTDPSGQSALDQVLLHFLAQVEQLVIDSAPAATRGDYSVTERLLEEVEKVQVQLDETLPAKRTQVAAEQSQEWQTIHVQKLRTEQRGLIELVYLRGCNAFAKGGEISSLLIWLQKRQKLDAIAKMGFAAFCAMLLPFNPDLDAYNLRLEELEILAQDDLFMQILYGQVVGKEKWQNGALWNLVRLEYFTFLELIEKLRPARRHGLHFMARQAIERAIDSVIMDGAIDDFNNMVISIPSDIPVAAKAPVEVDDEGIIEALRCPWPKVEKPYLEAILAQADRTTNILLSNYGAIKRCKAREDDRNKAGRVLGQEDNESRRDFVAFALLLAELHFRLPSGRGIKIWKNGNGKYLDQLTDHCQDQEDYQPLLHLLESISLGPAGSSELHDRLGEDKSVITYGTVRNMLIGIAESRLPLSETEKQRKAAQAMALQQQQASAFNMHTPAQNAQHQNQTAQTEKELPPSHFTTTASLCRLVTNVFRWHPNVAANLNRYWQGETVMDYLFQVVNRDIPASTMSAALDCLTAFGNSMTEISDFDAAKKILEHLQQLGVNTLAKRTLAGRAGEQGALRKGGWLRALESTDASEGRGESVIALIKMFTCVLQAQEKWVKKQRDTGHPYANNGRSPITHDLVQYVTGDGISLLSQSTNGSMAVKLGTAIFHFLDQGLKTFEVDSIIQRPGTSNSSFLRAEAGLLWEAIEQPGTEIMRAILAPGQVYDAIVASASLGYLKVGEGARDETLMVTEAMQLVLRVLEKQAFYIQVLHPRLANFKTAPLPDSLDKAKSRQVDSFDRKLAHHPNSVVFMATYLTSTVDDRLALLAVKVLDTLGQSPHFISSHLSGARQMRGNALALAIAQSAESLIILGGAVQRLEKIVATPLNPSREQPKLLGLLDGEQSGAAGVTPDEMTWLIHSALLDLMLSETGDEQTGGSTLAHFFLGYYNGGQHVSNRLVPEYQAGLNRNCFHVVMRQLREGLPDLNVEDSSQVVTMLSSDPFLARKTLLLVYQLARHDSTSTATMRFLRSEENFAQRQLHYLATAKPSDVEGQETGTVEYADGESAPISASSLISFTRYQALVLEISALEIHLVGPSSRSAAEIVKAFLESLSTKQLREGNTFGGIDVDQSSPLALDLLHRLFFEWKAAESGSDFAPLHFQDIAFETFKGIGVEGESIYDVEGLRVEMNRRIEKLRAAQMATETSPHSIVEEKNKILAILAGQNNSILAATAASEALSSWAALLDVVLFKALDNIASEIRQPILFDLAKSCLRWLSSPSVLGERLAILCQAVLTITSVLRQDLTAEFSVERALPIDQLLDLLADLLATIGTVDLDEMPRGYLYASLLNYMQTIRPTRGSNGMAASGLLEMGIASLLDKNMELVIAVICRDAVNGQEAWSSCAYTLMTAMAEADKVNQGKKLIGTLARLGFLRDFIRGLAASDVDIRAALSPEVEQVPSLYSLEAKFALLLRISQTRYGAERLVEAGLFETLSKSEWIQSKPQGDSQFDTELDAYNPSAQQKYYQILIPVLRLIVSVMRHGDVQACHRAYSTFVTLHRDTFLTFLKERPSITTLAVVESLQLLVDLLQRILPHIQTQDAVSASGFGAFDAAIKSLGTRFFDDAVWQRTMAPASAEEAQEDSRVGERGLTIFAEKAIALVNDLKQSILLYDAKATDGEVDESLRPAFVPSTGGVQGVQTLGNSFPVLGLGADLLNVQIDNVMNLYNDYEDQAYKVAQGDTISSQEVDQLVAQALPSTSAHLGPAQKLAAAQRILSDKLVETRSKLVESMDTVEALLVLLYRHFEHFYNVKPKQNDRLNFMDLNYNSQQAVSPHKQEVSTIIGQLEPSLDRLVGAGMVIGSNDAVAATRHRFLEVVVEQIKSIGKQ